MKPAICVAIVFFVLLIFVSPAASQIQLEDAFPNLTFTRPVDIQAAGDGSGRLFVVEKRGVVSVVENDPGTTVKKTFLDIQLQVEDSGSEQGLLGLAFHPQYPDTPYFYVNYTAALPDRSVISRFEVSGVNPDSADASSEFVILEVGQPFSNHNAGQLAFGPDGYLYVGMGDGGSGGDPDGNGQNLEVLLGKMLRIDVDSTAAPLHYAIPADNPYVGNMSGYREEIYASGFRNPWRYSFDPPTGRLWLGDVGQNDYEEIDVVTAGGNYGWNIMEGDSCYEPPMGCDTTGLEPPVWVYAHLLGRISVTGGYVYRGVDIPSLVGRYVYADYGAGTIWALDYDGVNPAVNDSLLDTTKRISSFGVDEGGELHLASFLEGKIFRLAPIATGIREPGGPRAAGGLSQNVPNPFNPYTRIAFDLSGEGAARVDVFDVRGRFVASLVRKRLPAGTYTVPWDGRDERGVALPSGVYFYRLVVDGRVVDVRRMALVR